MKCYSDSGTFDSHSFNEDYTCERCGEFDRDTALEDIRIFRKLADLNVAFIDSLSEVVAEWQNRKPGSE